MDRNELRTKLIDTAARLFAEKGLHGVSIRELSKEAGVSISMISYYFDGKEGLYASVLQEQFACFDYIDEIESHPCGPLEKIEEYIRWSVKRHRNNPLLLRFYTSELTNPTRYFASIVQPAIRKVLEILIGVVEQGIAARQFRPGLNPQDTALAMAGMVNYYFLSTLATEAFINHSPERDEELIRHYMDIFTTGILAPAPPRD